MAPVLQRSHFLFYLSPLVIVIKNYLKDRIGDEINALSACCAFNKKKRLNHMRAFVCLGLRAKNPQKRMDSADC